MRPLAKYLAPIPACCSISNGVTIALLVAILAPRQALADQSWKLASPSARLEVQLEYGEQLRYSVSLRGEQVIAPSQIDLNVETVGWLAANGAQPKATERSAQETIDFVVPRKYRKLDVAYNELALTFPKGTLVFRAYDEGVAYRWETALPGEIVVNEERAEFRFPGEPSAWFPEEESIFTHQERVYKHVPLAEVGAGAILLDGRAD